MKTLLKFYSHLVNLIQKFETFTTKPLKVFQSNTWRKSLTLIYELHSKQKYHH